MGIYDREYYRKEGPSFLDSFATKGQVCKWLVILNVGIWVLQLLTRQKVGDRFVFDGPLTSVTLPPMPSSVSF